MSSRVADLTTVFVAEQSRLRRLICRIIGDRAVAEDLVHETYIRVRNAVAATDVADHRGYLVRAATNIALDYRRRLAVARPASNSDAELAGLDDGRATPEAALASRQALATVAATLQGLPPRTRHAFEMHRFDECTMAEIAAELGVSIALVHKLIAEAFTALRDDLRDQGFLPPR